MLLSLCCESCSIVSPVRAIVVDGACCCCCYCYCCRCCCCCCCCYCCCCFLLSLFFLFLFLDVAVRVAGWLMLPSFLWCSQQMWQVLLQPGLLDASAAHCRFHLAIYCKPAPQPVLTTLLSLSVRTRTGTSRQGEVVWSHKYTETRSSSSEGTTAR